MKCNTSLSMLVLIALSTVICNAPAAKTECDVDPAKPGACFFPATPGPGGIVFCEDDGVIIWPFEDTDAERTLGRINPKGTIAAHVTGATVFAAACHIEDIASGICGTLEAPGIGAFSGETNFQLDGFVTPDGGASCPLVLKAKGLLYRDVGLGLEEVEIDTVLHFVKDKTEETGCRLQRCRVFAPTDGE